VMARLISPKPSERIVEPTAFEMPNSGVKLSEPNFFYVENSAHLNQRDFGILFPWLTKKVFGSQQPERVLRLNLRAQLQFLRSNGVPVARTWVGDLVEGAHIGKQELGSMGAGGDKGHDDGIREDKAIYDRGEDPKVECWHWIDIMGMGGESGKNETEMLARVPTREETQLGAGGSDNSSIEVSLEEDDDRQTQRKMNPPWATPLETSSAATSQEATSPLAYEGAPGFGQATT